LKDGVSGKVSSASCRGRIQHFALELNKGHRVSRMDNPEGSVGEWITRESRNSYDRRCEE
jgi:hypothetical protein